MESYTVRLYHTVTERDLDRVIDFIEISGGKLITFRANAEKYISALIPTSVLNKLYACDLVSSIERLIYPDD
ncbi:hypothetical protein AYI69_g7929 [Smittium culicis]|uniref:Uncharacterized protein n=1 Tax=Smittium culicis TaxID=133412 RepID=A0A1R1XNJ1_9FUNG|nr:hypothetical protein AYI69_g7929 [Smittium culicis]